MLQCQHYFSIAGRYGPVGYGPVGYGPVGYGPAPLMDTLDAINVGDFLPVLPTAVLQAHGLGWKYLFCTE